MSAPWTVPSRKEQRSAQKGNMVGGGQKRMMVAAMTVVQKMKRQPEMTAQPSAVGLGVCMAGLEV